MTVMIAAAQDAVNTYVSHMGRDYNETPSTQITDLVVDLYHLADSQGLDMWSILDDAERHYQDELAEEDYLDTEDIL